MFSDIDTSSAGAIVNQVCANTKNDREKAEALWKFITKKVYHWSPATGDSECHDPVKLVNVYGYGFCDDSAYALAGLWQAAGLKSRVWGLSGHVVPEVYYDNDWHMYDPDHRVFYLKQDGTVAGVGYLQDHPELVENTKDPAGYDPKAMARLYATKNDNSLIGGIVLGHKLLFDLLPGETYARFKDSKLGYIKKIYPEAPDPRTYSNSIFTYALTPHLLKQKKLPDTIVNFKPAGLLTRYLKPYDSSRDASIIYGKQFPFPIISATVTLDLVSRHKNTLVEVYLSGPKPGETKLAEISGKFKGQKSFHIPKDLTYGRYGYKLTIKAKCLKPRHLKLKNFQIKTTCQSSPSTFPDMDKQNSTLFVSFDKDQLPPTKSTLILRYYWQQN